MFVVCSYCRKNLGEKEPRDDPTTSHSICNTCLEHFERQWDGLTEGEYLDQFSEPVVLVDGETGRLIAANQQMADMLGLSKRSLFALLGGEAFECEYALLPGGCGKTRHCVTCTIRNLVTEVARTGEPRLDVTTYLDHQSKGQLEFRMSAEKRNGGIQLTIHRVAPRSAPEA